VKAELAGALQTMLSGGGNLQLAELRQMQQMLTAPSAGLADLRKLKEHLTPWLSHVATSGAGRSADVVRRDMLEAVRDLITMQAAAA
jgi:hypothetical protein